MVERVRHDLITGVSPNFNEILSRFDLSDKASEIDNVYRLVVGYE
jgi:hypothetical protein